MSPDLEAEDALEVLPEVLPVVEPVDLALEVLEVLAFVVDDLDVVPEVVLPLFEVELLEELGLLLLSMDVFKFDDDDGLLDDPPDTLDV